MYFSAGFEGVGRSGAVGLSGLPSGRPGFVIGGIGTKGGSLPFSNAGFVEGPFAPKAGPLALAPGGDRQEQREGPRNHGGLH